MNPAETVEVGGMVIATVVCTWLAGVDVGGNVAGIVGSSCTIVVVVVAADVDVAGVETTVVDDEIWPAVVVGSTVVPLDRGAGRSDLALAAATAAMSTRMMIGRAT